MTTSSGWIVLATTVGNFWLGITFVGFSLVMVAVLETISIVLGIATDLLWLLLATTSNGWIVPGMICGWIVLATTDENSWPGIAFAGFLLLAVVVLGKTSVENSLPVITFVEFVRVTIVAQETIVCSNWPGTTSVLGTSVANFLTWTTYAGCVRVTTVGLVIYLGTATSAG